MGIHCFPEVECYVAGRSPHAITCSMRFDDLRCSIMTSYLSPRGGIASARPRSKPCPCGFWNDPTRECRCSPLQIQRYVGRISGPLLDRIDIHIDVPAVRFRELTGDTPPDAEDSAAIRQRVIKAREQQRERFAPEGIFSNAAMTPRLIRRYCRVAPTLASVFRS